MKEENYWKHTDKNWMKQRKGEWRQVKFNLDLISRRDPVFKKSYHKFHKELFLYNKTSPQDWIDWTNNGRRPGGWDEMDAVDKTYYTYNGTSPFLRMLPLFKLWYHPNLSTAVIKTLSKELVDFSSLEVTRVSFFGHMFKAGFDQPYATLFNPRYGLLNGRESIAVAMLCKSIDSKQTVEIDRKARLPINTDENATFIPKTASIHCRQATRAELCGDARYVPNAPGQFLWEQFSMDLDKSEGFIYDSEYAKQHAKNEDLMNIAQILDFENRTDLSKNRPSTLALIESLQQNYEHKKFSEPMLKLWDEAKKDIKNLLDQGKGFITMTNKELNSHYSNIGGFPIKIQKERIAQWEQV